MFYSLLLYLYPGTITLCLYVLIVIVIIIIILIPHSSCVAQPGLEISSLLLQLRLQASATAAGWLRLLE